jgi:DNA-binding CsgD family transcriptional regulator
MDVPPVPPVRYATASDGTRIAYMRYPGESPPFLMINTPGAPPMAMRATMPMYGGRLAQFARARSMVFFDWRGSGLSDRVAPSIRIEDLVCDLEAITGAIGEAVDGDVAACFAAPIHASGAPERYRSLWIRRAAVRSGEGEIGIINRPGWDIDYREHLRTIGRMAWDVSNAEATRLAAAWEDGVPLDTFRAYRDAEAQVDLSGVLPLVTCPVWVTAEREADVRPSTEFVSLLPHALLSVWEPVTTTPDQGRFHRDEWERNLGSRLQPPTSSSVAAPAGLSPRETDVLRLVAAGRTNAEVASGLALSVRTVERHLENIYRKTGAANRTAASAWAIRNGLA